MSYDFSEFDKKITETKTWLKSELDKIRTGRASASVLDDITVESYGTDTPLNQLGGITNEGPRTLRINVYDASQIDAVEKALQQADIGASISKDDQGLRLNFPELTQENRQQAQSQAKAKLEEARVSLRSEREEAWNDIKELESNSDIAEDEKFRLKEKLESRVKNANKEMESMLEKKQEQLSQ